MLCKDWIGTVGRKAGSWSQRAVGALAVLVLVACATPRGHAGTWRTAWNTQSVQPDARATPTTARALCALVRNATEGGRRIRMTGSGHSPSDAAITRDVLLAPTGLTAVLPLRREALRDDAPTTLVRVQSGIPLRTLNAHLDEQGLALRNMGGWDAQTIVGAAMTGTHGSGLRYGPIASQVLSMQVVGEDGSLVQVEPEHGITDPARFAGHLPEDPGQPVRLVQDDERFQALAVSMGCLGIVYAVVLHADRKFWLREVRATSTWRTLTAPDGMLTRLLAGRPLCEDTPDPDYYEILYNPYPSLRGGDHRALVTLRYKSYEPLPEESPGARGRPGTHASTRWLQRLHGPATWALDTWPDLAVRFQDMAMDAIVDDGWSQVSYRVFNNGPVEKTRVVATEVAVALEQTTEAVERTFAIAAAARRRGRMLSSPISLRFVAASPCHVAMQADRPTAMLEFITLQDTRGAHELLKTFSARLTRELEARPHWGLDLGTLTSPDQAHAIYPRWDAWIAQLRRSNARGTFDGRLTDRLGISARPRPAPGNAGGAR